MNIENTVTVLIVEDETLVRMHGVDLLEEAGFQVIEAANADDALVLLRSHNEIGLLFSDIDMPGSMNGLELARAVHAEWPSMRLLLTSGHHNLTESSIPDDGKFVGKPWTEGKLIAKVQAVLAA
ncbi:response regulator [Novosphingobium sp. G106]|uniref:response regulator n=1 Tax=Novosphingobium sp. G106 TaxID=2849500 RepID=UPI001C2D8F81|nr:response regulator [Novosphingobium sp. G106]MBV1688436.1 response regulator [Novosphingobium sp. G106]